MINEQIFLNDFREMLKTDSKIEMDTDLLDIEEWDSFSMMSFIAMADEKYGVEFEPFSIAGAVLVEDLYNVVKESIERK